MTVEFTFQSPTELLLKHIAVNSFHFRTLLTGSVSKDPNDRLRIAAKASEGTVQMEAILVTRGDDGGETDTGHDDDEAAGKMEVVLGAGKALCTQRAGQAMCR